MSVQTGRMKTLVEDLLTLAKLEGNPEPPVTQVVPMGVMLSRLQSDAQGLSQGHHQIVVEKNSDRNVLGDDLELYSAFGNLVSNAVRYTPDGGNITIRWTDLEDGAIFTVIDTGPGIAQYRIIRYHFFAWLKELRAAPVLFDQRTQLKWLFFWFDDNALAHS